MLCYMARTHTAGVLSYWWKVFIWYILDDTVKVRIFEGFFLFFIPKQIFKK